MGDYDNFVHGGAAYPLTSSTANPLLKDADPSLWHALEFLSTMLQVHIGPRLQSQAALVGLTLANAVVQKIHVEPAPFLFADQFKFPTLAIYRKSEAYSDKAISYGQDVSEWEFAYLLPPLSPQQTLALTPILRSAAQVVRHFVDQGHHSLYNADEKVWTTAGLAKINVKSVRYGGYEPIQEIPNFYRAIVGAIEVIERDMPNPALQAAEGFDLHVDLKDADGTTIANVTEESPDT